MFRRLILQFLGFCFVPLVLVRVILSLIKFGWAKTFTVKHRDIPPAILQDPRWGQHKYIQLPGVKLHYVEKGDRSKPLMVFLHGFPEFWFSWRFQLEHFSDKYWCVAVDNRGYGDSDKPGKVTDYAVTKLATDVRNLILGLGRQDCILVGHDWGGAIGYAVCALYPEMVRAYVAINLPFPLAWEEMRRRGWEQNIKSWYMLFFQCPFIPEQVLRLGDLNRMSQLLKQANIDDEETEEAYKYTFNKPGAFTPPINYYRCVLQNEVLTDFFNAKIAVPTYSIFGTGDAFLSVDAAKLSKNYIEDFEDDYLEGVSHWSMMEEPKKVNALMEGYLKRKGL